MAASPLKLEMIPPTGERLLRFIGDRIRFTLRRAGDEWFVELAFTEVGWFKAKAYAVDERGRQIWPDGPDIGLSVHPDSYRTANTIYCAFTRLFGETKTAVTTADKKLEAQLKQLDKQGYMVVPASGKLRDLVKELPHIIDT